MNVQEFLNLSVSDQSNRCIELLNQHKDVKIHFKNLVGSGLSVTLVNLFKEIQTTFVCILNDSEEAAYFYTDLVNILGEQSILYYPASNKYSWLTDEKDHANDLTRSETLNAINTRNTPCIVVTYPEAIFEKVITQQNLQQNTLEILIQKDYSIDFISEFLVELGFEHVDFVYQPGQFSVRGGIVDVFSYADENPYRIEFFGDMVESIRSFNTSTQLSVKKLAKVVLIPDINHSEWTKSRCSFFEFIPSQSILYIKDSYFMYDIIQKEYTIKNSASITSKVNVENYYQSPDEILRTCFSFNVLESSNTSLFPNREQFVFNQTPQPLFKKKFDQLMENFNENTKKGYKNILFSSNAKQIERLYSIFENIGKEVFFSSMNISLHEGYIDHNTKLVCYTDHQIFERYHRYTLKEGYQKAQQVVSLKDLINLQKGDYVTHIQHGVGVYDGLEKINIHGNTQEAIRIIYKENDLLYVNIHSLHKIAKYTGKEGKAPSLDKLGSKAWQSLKQNTKKKLKQVAFDLIKLYAQRKTVKGFAFSPDNYLQTELESSFIYEDTPDQIKAIQDIKLDMEKPYPMDRLVCGDVGFGKTEVAIRAAFKAVLDGKQVVVLAPTTILTLQHYKTFSKRLEDFPCTVDYLNRFKSVKQQKETLDKLKEGKIDIIIGTHRLVSKDVVFKDLGLLIIDEEHKFGVGVKDKLKTIKTNVDTLTLTATPIPRTLQFSLMSARDLSVISTPPPNRQPVQTELHTFNEEVIQKAIYHEVSRSGQVFFIHNRVSSLQDIAQLIKRLCPEVSIAVGHGQMNPEDLEDIILKFMDGVYDVLISTTIVESGLDVPNANTMIIHDAHMFGLSDLHQMRGRVGRSNKKAYCYLITPPLSVISSDSRKRLKVIEQFTDLGSGFQISMRDLDIRGAGDLLGADQSGFISEMGYETYQKILHEAIQELKEDEFKEVFKEELEKKTDFVDECQLDTDLELLFPDYYINNVTERLMLYKELSDIHNEDDLEKYSNRLVDRFGALPKQVNNLLDGVRLQWYAKKSGFERITLKNKNLVAYFISNPNAYYYKSPVFQEVLKYIQLQRNMQLKQKADKLYLTISNVATIQNALDILIKIHHSTQVEVDGI